MACSVELMHHRDIKYNDVVLHALLTELRVIILVQAHLLLSPIIYNYNTTL